MEGLTLLEKTLYTKSLYYQVGVAQNNARKILSSRGVQFFFGDTILDGVKQRVVSLVKETFLEYATTKRIRSMKRCRTLFLDLKTKPSLHMLECTSFGKGDIKLIWQEKNFIQKLRIYISDSKSKRKSTTATKTLLQRALFLTPSCRTTVADSRTLATPVKTREELCKPLLDHIDDKMKELRNLQNTLSELIKKGCGEFSSSLIEENALIVAQLHLLMKNKLIIETRSQEGSRKEFTSFLIEEKAEINRLLEKSNTEIQM